MMIEFSYTLTDPAVLPGWEQHHEVAGAPGSDLLWSGFPGDVGITTSEAEIRTRFDWVPLLHIAGELIAIVDRLTDPGAVATYSFTESADELRFERSRELVRISATFTDSVLTTTMPELSDAVRRFVPAVLDDLTARYPGLAQNPLTTELRDAVARRSQSPS
ncbi:hypothetical protein [Kribbella sindirgiensis]|uniref:Uncharacterized protein n=1 Tax=Kribbella sindirgiensis TaxID=1124744 RepID=A0A4R0I549_9ACTN|nr:hypothetical protein [Kribbella sindirgiensis]TCC22328.1 hypothetical protein E0H50_34690 [Kribbella sindirgiensis]